MPPAAPAPVDPAATAALRSCFLARPGYLNTASIGLPATAVTRAMADDVAAWAAGEVTTGGYDPVVTAARAGYADLVGVRPHQVAIGSQVSVMTAMVAAALPDGAEVLCPQGEFTSLTYPFLTAPVRLRAVPLAELAEQVGPRTAAVAFSLVQSADGRLADVEAVTAAAARHGALTVVDTTQSAGWLPFDASSVDVTVGTMHKWLCAPRGAAAMTVSDRARDLLRPVAAGWYAGESVWDSVYGVDLALAADARRFDVAPVWGAWVGAAAALEVWAGADLAAVRDWDVALADSFLSGLGLPGRGSAIVSLPDPEGRLRRALTEAGCVVAGRGGGVRLAFHVYNTADDVALALDAVRG